MDRDKIAEDLLQSVPRERIIAAAALVIRRQRGLGEDDPHSFTQQEIADFLAGLNAEQLVMLRQIAESLEGGPVQ